MEAWIANPVCTNFKTVYERYELFVSREIEGVYITSALNELVNFWRQGALEPKDADPAKNHETYFVHIALPKIATRMVRTRYLNETLTHNVYLFIRKTVDIAIELMPLNIAAYSEFLVHAFDHASSFFSSKNIPAHLVVKFPNATLPLAIAATSHAASSISAPSSTTVETAAASADKTPTPEPVYSDLTASTDAEIMTNPEKPAAAASEPPPQLPAPNTLVAFDDEADELNPYASIHGATLHYASGYFPDLLNWFGSLGGFRAIFNQIALDSTPIVVVSTLLHALRNSCMHGFLFPRRLAQFTPKILQMAPITKGLSPIQLKTSKKEDLENMLRHLGLLLKMTMSSDEVADRLDQLGLRIAAQCLSSGILTQRLFALNFLGSAIDAVLPRTNSAASNSASSSKTVNDPLTAALAMVSQVSNTPAASPDYQRWLNIKNLVDWIRQSQILVNVFGDSSHSQLLKNAGKLMRFLAQYDGLTVADVELIWKCGSNSHESLANDALAVFFDIVGFLSHQLVEPILKSLESFVQNSLAAIAAIEPSQREEATLPIQSRDLHNIATLANRLSDGPQRMKLVNLLISIVAESPVRLTAETVPHLVEIFKTEWFRPNRLTILTGLLEVLKDEDSSNKSYFCSLIDPIVGTWTTDDPTTAESLKFITTFLGCPLEEFLIDELLRFKEQCRPLLTPETYGITDGLVLAGSTLYIRELQNRLYLLYHIYFQGQGHLTTDSMLRLWDSLYQGAFNFGEAEEAAEWFKAAAADGSLAIPPTLADQLFQARFLTLDFQNITPAMYCCFERFFVYSNVVMQNMSLVTPKAGQQAPAEPEFEVSTHPDKLIGETALWDIALTNSDSTVVQACLRMLIKCMEQLHPTLQLDISPVELREHFISKCLGRVPEWVSNYKALDTVELSASEESVYDNDLYHLEKLISNALSLLVHMMDSLEPAASKRSTVTRGMPQSLRIQTALEIPTEFNPGNVVNVDFGVACDSSTTFAAFQALVAARLEPLLAQHNIHADDLVYVQTYPWYRRLDHDVSVGEASLSTLELYDRDPLRVLHLPSVAGRETNLRSRKGNAFKNEEKVRPADAEARIQQICEFAEWSAELAEFALKTHAWDVEQVGNSIMDEGRRHKLLNDAKKAGIGKQESKDDSGAPSAREIVQIMKQRTDAVLSLTSDDPQANDFSLPSVILSSNKSHFDALFNLLTLHNDAVSTAVWQIILRIPTSLSIKTALLSRDTPDWAELLPLDVYRLNYTVQIIDQILCPIDDSWQLSRRLEWARWFQETGGVAQLFKVVSHFETEPMPPQDESQQSESQELPLSVQTQRDCLTTTLKILDVFLSSFAESLDLVKAEEVPIELSPAIIENIEEEGESLDLPKPTLAPQHSDLRTAYTAFLKETKPVMLPLDCEGALKHLQEVLAWGQQSKPQIANGPLVGYAWRCFVNISLASRSRQNMAIVGSPASLVRRPSKGEIAAPETPVLSSASLKVILDLLTDLNHDIRRETATNMLHLAMIDSTGSSAALLLKSLLNSLPPTEEIQNADLGLAACYARFYWLLEWLVKLRLSQLERDSPGSMFGDAVVQQFGGLVDTLIGAIKLRPALEIGAHTLADHILNGSIRVLTAILRAWPTEYTAPELLTELYHGCMFTAKSASHHSPKCKTHTSRTSTYELLLALARLSNENKLQLLSMLSANHASQYQRMQSWDFHPGNEDKSSAGYVGLVNLGATCYMNSLLQQFYMMPTLRRDLLAAPVVLGPEEPLKENMVYQFHQLMGNLQETEKAAHNPKEFTGSYRDIEGNVADVGQQQDVSEFFNIVCGTLETLLKGTEDERLLQRNLGCVQVSQIKSLEPEFPFTSEREEELYAIPLDVRLKNNFNDAMDLFVKQDILEGDNKYKCEEHQRHIVATKGNLIKTMSNTLIFHLMRFDYDVATYRKRKLNEYFNFPMRINMKRWTKSGQAQMAQEQAGAAPIPELQAEFPEEYYEYQLAGILVHTGSADSGHYYSFIKERQAPSKWYQFNDRVVSEFDPNAIPHECFGGYHSVKEWDQHLQKDVWHDVPTERSAYMLFYERVTPMAAAPTKPASETPALLPGNRKVLRPSSYIEGVPSEVYNRVWDDNSTFLKVRQIFDPAYFEFMRDFAALWTFEPFLHLGPEVADDITSDAPVLVPGTSNPQNVELAAVKTITRLTLEIVAHSKDNLVLTSLLNQLAQLLANHVPAAVWFIEYVRRHNLIKELLLSCHIERSRIAFLDFFTQLMHSLARGGVTYCPPMLVKGNGGPSVLAGPTLPTPAENVIVTTALDLLEESRAAWRRFKQYFGLIREFARLGNPQRQFLLKKELISQYVDYFMGQSTGGVIRVRVMDEDNFPDLVEFIDTITLLTLSCKNENPAPELSDVEATAAAAQGPSIFNGPPRSKLQVGDLEMPATSKQDMYYATDFFTSLLEMDYNSPSTGDMLEYICWHVKSRTDYVLDHLLTKIDVKPSENKAPVLEFLLYRVLSIDDDLRQHRVERVMGKVEVPSSLGKYSIGSKLVKSLLLLAQSTPAYSVLYMVGYLRLIETLPSCLDFVLKKERVVDLLWLRKFWKTQFETQFPNVSCDSSLMADAQLGLHHYFSAAADLVHPRHPAHPRALSSKPFDEMTNGLEPWRRSVPYLALVFCTWLAQANGNTEPAYEDIVLSQEKDLRKLRAELEQLKKEKKVLVKALVYVHDTYPTAKLQAKLQLKVEDIIREDLFSLSSQSSSSSSRITSSGRPITSISYLSAATGGGASAAAGAASASGNNGTASSAASSPSGANSAGGGGQSSPGTPASASLAPASGANGSPASPTSSGVAGAGSPASTTVNAQYTEIFRSMVDDDDDEDGIQSYPPRSPVHSKNNGTAAATTTTTVAAGNSEASGAAAAESRLNGGGDSAGGSTAMDTEMTTRGTSRTLGASGDTPSDPMTTPQSSGEFNQEDMGLSKPTSWTNSELSGPFNFGATSIRSDPFDEYDEHDSSVMFISPSTMWRAVQTMSSASAPSDWEDRVANLKSIGMCDNDAVLKLLLEENHWSVENAANDLFDPDTLSRLQKKAAKTRSEQTQAGSDQEMDDGEVIIHR